MTTDLLTYEKELFEKGYKKVVGIDEAGRGPLAGPLCVGGAIMDIGTVIEGVNDSKKLSEKKREFLYGEITEKAIGWKVELVSPEIIDKINILNATKAAMKKVVSEILPTPDFALIDAVDTDFSVYYMPIIKGDAKSYSIAAASILAKVTRDRIMREYAELYPEYGFEDHKGYGTKHHIEMLKKYGPCPIHRKTFIGHFVEV